MRRKHDSSDLSFFLTCSHKLSCLLSGPYKSFSTCMGIRALHLHDLGFFLLRHLVHALDFLIGEPLDFFEGALLLVF